MTAPEGTPANYAEPLTGWFGGKCAPELVITSPGLDVGDLA